MDPLTLVFYDEILPGDAARILAQLQATPHAAVHVRINSPGGSVVEGLAIYNALKPRAPTVFIDGIAASIASLIAMAGSHIIAAENAIVMIHDPWTDAEGNATALRKTADLLDKHASAMLGAYARTGLPRAQLIELLAAETWMTAQEALSLGFVDEIAEPLAFAAHAPACFAGYKHTPPEILMPTSNPSRAADHGRPATATIVEATAGATANSAAAPAAANNENVEARATSEAVQALKHRNDEIMAIASIWKNNEAARRLTIEALADPTLAIQQFRDRMLSLLGAEAEPLGGRGYIDTTSEPGGSDFVAAASDAIAMRAGIKIAKPHPGARDIQGMALGDIMRACVRRSGHALDLGAQSKGGIVRAAMTTSDFPAILENTLGKTLRAGFEAEPSTFEVWTNKVTVQDFKPQSRVILGSAPELDPVLELGKYTEGSMDEDKSVPYSVGKYGKIVSFSWEALINDDLSAFMRISQAMGQAAARTEADAIYATFAENSGEGPEMQDDENLFGSAHSNVAASAAGITADALSAARVLLRRQKAVGGGVMNITPRFLLVAPEQEQDAETLLAAAARSLSQGSDITLVPAWLAQLQLVVEARLDGSAFYLLAAPTSIDTLERAWLDADNGPVMLEENSFGVDATRYKVRHVFGQRWLDWRGVVKVPLS